MLGGPALMLAVTNLGFWDCAEGICECDEIVNPPNLMLNEFPASASASAPVSVSVLVPVPGATQLFGLFVDCHLCHVTFISLLFHHSITRR